MPQFMFYDVPELTDAEAADFTERLGVITCSGDLAESLDEYLPHLRDLLQLSEEVAALAKFRRPAAPVETE